MIGVIDTDTDSVEQPVQMLLVDNVHLLTLQEAEALKPVFSKMFYFASLAAQLSRREPGQSFDMPGLGPQPNRTSAPRLLVFVCALSVDADKMVSAVRPDLAPLQC
jgi:hypothetical protein